MKHLRSAARAFAVCALLCAPALPGDARAEPYFAIMTGQKCVACHVNVTGGGKRTDYGNAFAQKSLVARPADDFWNGRLMEYLAVGGNVRGNASTNRVPNQEEDFEFDLEEALVYLEFPLLEDRLTLYLDQQVAPGSSIREAYALFHFRDRSAYVKAGKLFLPFGWRLQDDAEFIREVPGINYNTPDDGVEAGIEVGPSSLRLAVTNGTAGGAETDRGKQWSLHYSFVQRLWRIGASANYNDAGSDARTMYSGFAGVRTGPISWLGELDYIEDDGLGPRGREQLVGFVEGNWWIRQGHNLKLTVGRFDPDRDVDEDERNRYSLVYEWFPVPYTQLRAGYRRNEGIPQNDLQNAELGFLQLHVYF